MMSFKAEFRRAIAPSIFICFLQFKHINVDNYMIYYRVSRGDHTTKNGLPLRKQQAEIAASVFFFVAAFVELGGERTIIST